MDPERFDRLAKSVGRGGSRRGLLGGLLGSALLAGGLAGWAPGEEVVAREGVLDGRLGGRHGPNRRGRDRDRAHGDKKDKKKDRKQKGNSQNAKRCQKGGWATLAPSEAPTTPFANQAACVSYGAQGGTIVDLVISTVTVTWIQVIPDNHAICLATVAVSGFAPGTYDVRFLGPGGADSIEGSITVGTGGRGTTTVPTNGSFTAGVTYVIEVNGIQSEASTVAC